MAAVCHQVAAAWAACTKAQAHEAGNIKLAVAIQKGAPATLTPRYFLLAVEEERI